MSTYTSHRFPLAYFADGRELADLDSQLLNLLPVGCELFRSALNSLRLNRG